MNTHEVHADIVTDDGQGVNKQSDRYQRLQREEKKKKKKTGSEENKVVIEKEIP